MSTGTVHGLTCAMRNCIYILLDNILIRQTHAVNVQHFNKLAYCHRPSAHIVFWGETESFSSIY